MDLESPDLFKDPSDDAINIDSVFKNIKSIYDRKLLKITYNTMLILEDEKVTEAEKKIYLEGLLLILSPTNDVIRKWIREKLTC